MTPTVIEGALGTSIGGSHLMRAFLVTSAGVGSVEDVPCPRPERGEVVVDVAYVGICGTDVSLFHGDLARIRQARSSYPLRLGHEWSGTVSSLGDGVDPVSYTHLRAHETDSYLVCRLLLEKKK